MTLTDTLNACLKSLKRSVQGNDEAEMRGLCANLNHALSACYLLKSDYPYNSYPSLKISIQVDHKISETPQEDETYRPNADFWRRVYQDYGDTIPFRFDICQPVLEEAQPESRFSQIKYNAEFVCTARRKVECRIYISESQGKGNRNDDIVLPRLRQPCLIVHPHEIIRFAQNGPRNVTTFSFPE